MEKKYLKKVLTGLSIASLVTGIGGFAVGASGWSGSSKGAVSTPVEEKTKAPEAVEETKAAAPGYGEEKKEAAPGYGEEKKEAAPGYGK